MTWVRWRGPCAPLCATVAADDSHGRSPGTRAAVSGPTHGPAQLTGADTAHQLLAWSALPVGEPREWGMLADAAAILTCWQGRRKP